ncbi:YfiR/HmsC family protein [Aquimarina sp. 2304DJ70-9]|uniref:YfiR/HmsC family protein n=1 Tax=Aquimarina penaris TaxID=3231044 RepID=UPI0034621444
MMYRFQYIYALKTQLLSVVLCFFAITFSLQLQAQNTSNEEVKRLQRAIFIFNFAQQIEWQNLEEKPTFKIGVLGPDRTILDLQALSQKRKIHGKPVEIVRFQLVKDVKDIQLLYVNHKYNYGIHYVLSKISDKNILLVSEDYNFNASMINMVNVGDSFEYEVNSDRIENEEFLMAPSLKRYAITSSEKWKRLFRKAEKSLTKVQEENREHKTVIQDKEKEIQGQKNKITDQLEKIDHQEREIDSNREEIVKRNEEIERLYTESIIQQKKFEEKAIIEEELEKNIQEQITFIKKQEEKIKASNVEIDKRNDFLEQQDAQIKQQDEILEQQNSEIDIQKKINMLLIALVVLAIGVSFVIYRSYLAKKRFNIALEKKNKAIYEQSVELEAKNKELEQFAYIASHDLQEPLNTISSFIGLIAEDYGDSFDEVGKESLTFIKDASIRMKKLIDALLEYSRLGRSKDYSNVDCNSIFKELAADLKSIIEQTGAKIDVNNLPIVKGSEVELRLLFQNLISNAIKFREPNSIPEIDISCTKKKGSKDISNGFWEFSIRDNGIGIPEQHKERIFAIFQRLHSREQYQGTGIGLAHCKKIVESHGGTIWLESQEGKGSTFYFTIPC